MKITMQQALEQAKKAAIELEEAINTADNTPGKRSAQRCFELEQIALGVILKNNELVPDEEGEHNESTTDHR